MRNLFKEIGKVGLATGEILVNDAVQNILYGIEYFDPLDHEPAIGNLEDIIAGTSNGFCIDGYNILRSDITNTVALFASTGSGKSTIAMMGQLARMTQGSAIVFDPGGTLINTAPRFHRLGFKVHNINYSDILNSASLNFFHLLKSDDDVSRFSSHLAHSHKGPQSDMFFVTSAISLNSFLMKLIRRMEKKYHSMANLVHVLNAFASKNLHKVAARYCTDQMFSEYKSLVSNQSERTIGSIILTCKSFLEHFNSEVLCRATSISTIDLDCIRSENTIIYITANVYDATYYQTLTSISIELTYRALMREVKPNSNKVFFLLDECAICNLPSLSEVVSTCRKFNIYNLLCYQSQNQLFHAYGKELATNIISNSARLYYGFQEQSTARELSELFGKREIIDKQGRSKYRCVMDAESIIRMKRDEGLFVCKNVGYRLKLFPYYRQPLIKMQLEGEPYKFINPYIPSNVELIPLA